MCYDAGVFGSYKLTDNHTIAEGNETSMFQCLKARPSVATYLDSHLDELI
jgi:hypothetical protein